MSPRRTAVVITSAAVAAASVVVSFAVALGVLLVALLVRPLPSSQDRRG